MSALIAASARLVAGVSGRAWMELVASTTRLLIEAMVEVNVSPAVVLSASDEAEVKDAAVESVESQ